MGLIENIDKYLKDKKSKFQFKKNMKNIFYQEIKDLFLQYEDILSEIEKIGEHQHFLKTEIEDKILSLVEEDESVLRIQDTSGYTIGHIGAIYTMERLVLRALDDPIASTLQSKNKKLNIGMLSAIKELKQPTLKALDNNDASIQQDYEGHTIGILSINFKDDDCLLKALDNKEASRIQDYKGWHIGLYCAQGLRKEASKKAILNKELRNLRDKNDISMMEILLWKRDKGMEEIYQEAKDLMEKENNENFNDIENDVMEN